MFATEHGPGQDVPQRNKRLQRHNFTSQLEVTKRQPNVTRNNSTDNNAEAAINLQANLECQLEF